MEDELTNFKNYKLKTLTFNILSFLTQSNIKQSKKKYGLLDIKQYYIEKNIIINNSNFNLHYKTIYDLTKKYIPFLKNKHIYYKICVLKNYKNVCFIGIIIKYKLEDIIQPKFINRYIHLMYEKTLFYNIKNCFLISNNINLLKGVVTCNLNHCYFNEKINITKDFTLNLLKILNLIKPYYFLIK